jgi:hypothetical protein
MMASIDEIFSTALCALENMRDGDNKIAERQLISVVGELAQKVLNEQELTKGTEFWNSLINAVWESSPLNERKK